MNKKLRILAIFAVAALVFSLLPTSDAHAEGFFGSIVSALWNFLSTMLGWLFDWLGGFMPEWLQPSAVSDIFANLSPAMTYFAGMFAIDIFVMSTLLAYGARFIKRCIPLIG